MIYPLLCLVHELFRVVLGEARARKAGRKSHGWCRQPCSPGWKGRAGYSGALPPALGTSRLQEVLGQGPSLSQGPLEINCTLNSHVLNSPEHLHLGFSGQALHPSVFLLAAGLCPSLAPHLFCCGYFSLAPITLRLTPKQTSPGTWRYLAGSDRLVPRLAPGLIKDPQCRCAGVWACKM